MSDKKHSPWSGFEPLEPRVLLSAAYLQDAGADHLLVAEAENAHLIVNNAPHYWELDTSVTGYSGSGAMKATPNTGTNHNTNYTINSPRLDYEVYFEEAGVHHVWIRGHAPVTTGVNDSVHVGLDGAAVNTSNRIDGFGSGYRWSNHRMDGGGATIDVPTAGFHTINVWMREDGFVFDKLLLTTDANYTPTGNGPDESPQNQPPVASDTILSVAEDAGNGTAVGVITANDPDAAPVGLSYAIISGNTDGVFAIDSQTGQVTVADNTNLDYETTTQYILTAEVSDGIETDTAVITIDVTDTNDNAPIAIDASFSVDQSAIHHGGVTATDIDTVGTRVYEVVSGPSHGTLSAFDSATGSYSYDPVDTHIGSDSFTFRVYDGTQYSNTATVTIDVTGVVGSVNLLGDSDMDANFVHGPYTAGSSPDGVWFASHWDSVPDAGPDGVGDNAAQVINAFSEVKLFQGIDAPAAGTTMTLVFDYLRPGGFTSRARVYGLTNGQIVKPFSSVPGDIITEYVLGTQTQWAQVDQQFTVNGSYDKLLVIFIVGGNAGTKVDNVELYDGIYTPPNQVPVANNHAFSVDKRFLHPGVVTADDADSDAALSYEIVDGPSHGTITDFDPATGQYVYNPEDTYEGPDSFTFRAFDGIDYSAPATVSATVNTQGHVNLLDNAGFETGNLSDWTTGTGISITTTDPHSGTYAIDLDQAKTTQVVDTRPGVEYRATVRMRFISDNVTGPNPFGGAVVRVLGTPNNAFGVVAQSPIYRMGAYGDQWFEASVTFTAERDQTRMDFGYVGGDRDTHIVADDARFFITPEVNLAPTISNLTVSNLTDLATDQAFSATIEDAHGSISEIFWDFGDGDRVFNLAGGARHVSSVGSFVGTLYVIDDDGARTSQTFNWSASDSAVTTITVASPPAVVTTATVTLTGTIGSPDQTVLITTDRGQRVDAIVTGMSWTADLPLANGNNQVIAQVTDAQGDVDTQDFTVRYEPVGALAVTNAVTSSTTVEKWKEIELTFQLDNSAATHAHLPYDPTPAAGNAWVDGITADAVFWNDADPATAYTRPAFLFQDYDIQTKSNIDWLYPEATPVWTARFAPPSEGNWSYRIDVTEAKGTASSAVGSFTTTAVTDPDNHGPIVVSPTDSRYFEYADGTPFLGGGITIGPSQGSVYTDTIAKLDEIGQGNEQLVRWWTAGQIWSSAWTSWRIFGDQGGGNTPATGLTIESGYGHSLASGRLSNDSDQQILFQGWNTARAGLIPGQTYRVSMRVRTEGVTGPVNPADPYGVTFKSTFWPGQGTSQYDAIIPHVNGDTPWHVVEGTFVATRDHVDGARFATIAFENAADGVAYVDQISLYEIQPDGSNGPQLFNDSDLDMHQNFDDRHAKTIEAVIDHAETLGITFRMIIEEKEDALLPWLSDYGLPTPSRGSYFDTNLDNADNALRQSYWRYLFARFGSSPAIHSWELANEANPAEGNSFVIADQLGQLAAADGNPHLATHSTWGGAPASQWLYEDYDNIAANDFHAYTYGANITDQFSPSVTDAQLQIDTARFFIEHDNYIASQGLTRPTFWGEMGQQDEIAPRGIQEFDLALDTEGVWLHKIQWARTGAGGVYPIQWYIDNLFDHDLHDLYGNWLTFMEGVPISNGHFVDADAASNNTNVRVVGQKDLTHDSAHLWIDNASHTWRNVIDGVTINPENATITVDMGEADTSFDLSWHDTSTGLETTTQTLISDASGIITISVVGLATDTAVKIEKTPPPPPAPVYAAEFNGETSTGTVADSASLDLAGNVITIEAWIYNQGPEAWDTMKIFRRKAVDTAGNGWVRQHGLSGFDNGRIIFGLVLDGIWFQTTTAVNDLPDNDWAHVAGVYDGSTMKIYINGAEKASIAANGNLATNDFDWSIGDDFQGRIDELRVSSVARYTGTFTPATSPLTTDANTALLVHFNEGLGNIAEDVSGNDNHVTLTDVAWNPDTPMD